MACLLATTWFIVEAFLIPEGLLKWFYLSFYIHPLILVLCQILLWVRLLVSGMRRILAVLIRFLCFTAGLLVSVLPGRTVAGPEGEVFVDAYGDMSSEEHSVSSFCSNDLNILRAMAVVLSKVIVEEEKPGVAVAGTVIGKDEEADEDATSVCSSQLTLSPLEAADGKNIKRDLFCEKDEHMTMAGLEDAVPVSSARLTPMPSASEDHMATRIEQDPFYWDLFCEKDEYMTMAGIGGTVPVSCSRLTPMPSEADDCMARRIEQDPFYRKYEQIMVWFDLLNHERTCGISATLQAESEETTLRISSIWDERAKKRLIRSLESDLELVYVAQTCLSWEILCYQQKKVEDLSTNSSSSRASSRFNHVVVKELQKFQVLMQRFTEDERFLSRCRYREYVQARASCKSLLQVPEIPGTPFLHLFRVLRPATADSEVPDGTL